jgi:hypothetical protein
MDSLNKDITLFRNCEALAGERALLRMFRGLPRFVVVKALKVAIIDHSLHGTKC